MKTLGYRYWFDVACTVRRIRGDIGFIYDDGVERQAALNAAANEHLGKKAVIDGIEAAFRQAEHRVEKAA